MGKLFQGAYSQRYNNYTTSNKTNIGTSNASASNYNLSVSSGEPEMGEVSIVQVSAPSTPLSSESVQSQQLASRGGYPSGVMMKATAKAHNGYRFVQWQTNIDGIGGTSGKNTNRNPVEFKLTKDTWLIARFERAAVAPTVHTVRVNWNDGMGRVSANGLQNGAISVESGDSITLTATPKTGYVFAGWSGINLAGNVQSNLSKTITLTVTRDMVLTANFNAEEPGVGGGSTDGPGTGGGGGGTLGTSTDDVKPVVETEKTTTGKVMAFVKKWWWAILIVAYIVYKEKGGSK